jgi:hypothetical protein
MINHNQNGAINGLLISLILTVLLLVGALGFAGWAYGGRQDYKNNVNAKIGVAVNAAKQKEDAVQAAQYAEAAKNPLKTYAGPQAYGSLVVNYPKTWSGYVDDTGTGNALVDGYFSPGVVPSINGKNSVFALRVQVIPQSYAQSLQTFSSQQQAGQVTITAYALPKLPKVVGVEIAGALTQGQPATTMIVLPLRSYTMEISTQGTQYLSDFNNIILPNFSFSP